MGKLCFSVRDDAVMFSNVKPSRWTPSGSPDFSLASENPSIRNTPSPFPELPADVIKMAKDIKPITEIKQSGNDFVVTSKTPGKTVTNSFTIGKEADITTMDGKKLKVCPSSIPGMSAFLFSHRCFFEFYRTFVTKLHMHGVIYAKLYTSHGTVSCQCCAEFHLKRLLHDVIKVHFIF